MGLQRSNHDYLVGLATTLVVVGAGMAGLWQGVDGTITGWGVQLAPERDPGDRIAVVEIDEASLAAREGWAELAPDLNEALTRINNAGASVVGLALPPEWALADAVDPAAAAGSDNAAPVILGIPWQAGPRAPESGAREDWVSAPLLASAVPTPARPDGLEARLRPQLDLSRPVPAGRLLPAWPNLDTRILGTGFLPGQRLVDTREPPAILRVHELHLPALSLHLAARLEGLSMDEVMLGERSGIQLGERRLGTDGGYRFRPHVYTRAGDDGILRISLDELLQGQAGAGRLQDRAVIIGVSAENWADSLPIPGGRQASIAEVVASHTAALVEGHLYAPAEWNTPLVWSAIALVGLYLMFLLPRLGVAVGGVLSFLLAVALFNAQLGIPVIRMNEVQLATPLLALVIGHGALAMKQYVDGRRRRAREALSTAKLQLAEALQKQGQLDAALEHCLECEPSRPVLRRLYELALDMERRRRFAKAKSVLQHIEQIAPDYKDVGQRIRKVGELEQRSALGNARADAPTLILSGEGMQKPVLGHYEIEAELGRGAMGVVYRGKDPRIGRTVAIKTMALSQEFDGDDLEEVTQRFFREAETAGRLKHPSIVTIYDVGEEGDLAYIAMDYLQGKGLEHYTEPGKLLPIGTVFDIIAQVAEALEYAHEHNVVHRDIKPANMIYDTSAKRVIVTDFGVAGLTDTSKTKTGTILGTPSYMSPEQVLGRKADGRSDLFSLGVTFYEMICGELPFDGEPMATLMYKIANEPHIHIRKKRPDLPPCVTRIVNRALAKKPQDRFASGGEMAKALRKCRPEVVGQGGKSNNAKDK